MDYAGPLWTGQLYDTKLAEEICKNNKDKTNERFLKTILDESGYSLIGFYDIHAIAKKYKLAIKNFDIIFNDVRKKGYFAARTHFSSLGIKTDMPISELVKIMK